MKIIIKAYTDNGKEDIVITDESLDNDGFIDIVIGDFECTIDSNEIMSALIAFDAKRSRNKYEE